MAGTRRSPIRTCIACRRPLPKAELNRLALVEGRVVEDREKKYGGRGAYVCHELECLDRILRNDRRCLDRAFRKKVKFLDLAELKRKIEAEEVLQGV